VSGQISPFPTLDLAKYAFAEHDGHVHLIPVTNGGKQKRGRLSSDDAGWNGAENAGDDLGERFLSASTRAQERAPLNPCRAWQPKAGGMSEAVKMWLVAEYASVGGERRAEYKAFDSAKEANTESKS
jgi:hypothetical protein